MTVDHIVYGVEDLEVGVDELARLLGVRATPGGKHVGRGTHNALLALGGRSYLEIIAIDPDQPQAAGQVAFGLDSLRLPRLVGWATSVTDIEARAQRARERGYDPGPVQVMSRRRPDGALLEWRLTRPAPDSRHLVVPFLIDWLGSPHPSETSPAGITLVELRALDPDPASVRRALDALGVEMAVDDGPESALVATLNSPNGRVVLR